MFVRTVRIAVLGLAVLCAGSCSDKKDKRVKGESYLLNSEDFDLETVVGLIRDNKVKNVEELEEQLNADTGLSNVDIDGDEQIDYVIVRENREGNNYSLDFLAVPTSTNDENDAETIASVQVEHKADTGEVHVRGGYPSYVHGHNHHYYHYHRPHSGLATGMFLAWMLTPSRPYYYGRYRTGWSSRPVYSRSRLSTKRSSYRSSRSVGPMKSKPKPSNYKIASAARTKSRIKSGAIKSRAGKSRTFSKRNQFKKKRSASGFGSSGRKSKSSVFGGSKSGSKSKSGFGSRSGKRSRSFGSSSGSRSRSRSFGSSSRSRSRSRSFGGRRRR